MNYGKNMISIYFVYNSCFCLGVQDGDEEQYAQLCPFRIQWTQGKHVQAQLGTSHSTRSVSSLGLL